MKDLIMKYVMTSLMHEMSKCKEKEPQGEDATMVSHQSKASDLSLWQGVRTCFYCNKMGRTTQLCYKTKNNERENAKITKKEDKFAVAMQHGAHSRSVCKWIMNSGATKYMTSHKAAFNTSEVIFFTQCAFG